MHVVDEFADRAGNFLAAPEASPLPALRQAIRRIEARGFTDGTIAAAEDRVRLRVAPVDRALEGGLARAALHEVAAGSEAQIAAASGFTLALAGRAAGARAVLWIVEDMGCMESGGLYGPGLEEFGVAPEQLILVSVAHARAVLWAMEEALRCCVVGVVVGELRAPGAISPVASRRLSLATLQHKIPALLLRAKPDARPLAAMTRWSIGTARARPAPHGTGPPTFAVELTRNQCGRVGFWVLEWNRDEQRFELASAHSQSVAAATVDRPPLDFIPRAESGRPRRSGVG